MDDLTEAERDQLAQSLVLTAFAIELLVELSAKQKIPMDWIRKFTERLHARIDAHAENHPAQDWPHIHERARATTDTIGHSALELARLRRGEA